jgi:mannose-6-phosphate isomerase
MDHRHRIVRLPPHRVWRTYQGGRQLDELAGAPAPADSHFPEDWIASTTRAINPGREHIPEGVSPVLVGTEPTPRLFSDLLASDPAGFLGDAHATRYGASPQLLVKFLDPSIRLHFQVHPTPDFARRFLSSPSGKTEAYHILAVRQDLPHAPYLYLGFQHPPSRAGLRRMIETQDIAALEACFEKIPVNVGDTFLVPGGVPHALGPGILLAEIQEPSDLVVRFEFERGGYVLPESARFMGRGLDFCLGAFDLTPWPVARVLVEGQCPPRRRRALGADSWQDDLIGPERTPCFRLRKSHVRAPIARDERECFIGIVTAGEATLTAAGESHRLRAFDKFFLPAQLGPWQLVPSPTVEILECYPPAA